MAAASEHCSLIYILVDVLAPDGTPTPEVDEYIQRVERTYMLQSQNGPSRLGLLGSPCRDLFAISRDSHVLPYSA